MIYIVLIAGITFLFIVIKLRQSIRQTKKTNEEAAYYLRLIESGSLNTVDQQGNSLLHVLLKKGWYYHVEKLLEKGYPFKTENIDEVDPLTYVILQEGRNYSPGASEKFVRLFSKFGADVNKINDLGISVLALAAANGSSLSTVSLIKAGADVNLKSGPHRLTPLMYALVYKEPYVGRLLLDHGAGIYVKNNNGETVLNMTDPDQYMTFDLSQWPPKKAGDLGRNQLHDLEELYRRITYINTGRQYQYRRPAEGMQEGID